MSMGISWCLLLSTWRETFSPGRRSAKRRHEARPAGGGFRVATDGPGGSGEFEVAYVFGVEPLQQYLLALPRGRLQALTVAWDTRPKAQSGQRWFHLYPDEVIAPDDPLHWTGRLQNWNLMCAECHSTALEKGYDFESDTYETTWSEIDVSCEACTGPGP